MAESEPEIPLEKRERDEGTEVEEPPAKQRKTEDNGEIKKTEGVEQAPPNVEGEIASPTKPQADESNEKQEVVAEPESKGAENKQNLGGAEEASAEPTNVIEKPAILEDTASEAAASQPAEEAKIEAEATAATAPSPGPAPSPAPVPAPAATGQVSGGLPAGLPPGLSQDANTVIEERGSVSALYVGRVIGKGGEMIRDLQARSSCRIDVDQNVPPNQPRVITYRGTRRTVDFAKRLVEMLCRENASEADLPLGDAKREYLVVPAQSVGKIIGRGGEMIRELQSRSQAKIQVDHNSHNGMDQQKHVTITGTELAVTKAKEMVMFLVANPLMDAMQAVNMLVEDKVNRGGVWGSGPPYPNLPNMGQNMQPSGGYDQQPHYGSGQQMGQPGYSMHAAQQPYGAHAAQPYGAPPPGYQQNQQGPAPYAQYGGGAGGVEMEIFYAAKNFMGRIIGQKGVTINDLQRRSACDIQINQDVPPGRECEISIRGSRQGIEMTKQMLREIIEIGPNHPYAGGGPPAHAGGYQHGGYGQQPPQYGYQQEQANYNQGYGQTYGQAYGHQGYNQGYQAPVQSYAQPAAPYQQAPQPYAAPQVAPAVSPWKSAASPDGQIYYYNERTGETQWEKPAGMP